MRRIKRFLRPTAFALLIACLLTACSSKSEDMSCTISIETGEGEILAPTAVGFPEGSSVLDVLKKATRREKIQMEFSGSGLSAYVNGIDNLYEFDKGPESGWIYYVNGERAGESCGSRKVGEGDIIRWVYVLEIPPIGQ